MEPTGTALRECDTHAVMKEAAFGRQRRQSRCDHCHVHMRLVHMRLVPLRIGISGAYRQCHGNRRSRKYRFRHDRTSLVVQRRMGVLRLIPYPDQNDLAIYRSRSHNSGNESATAVSHSEADNG
jgi:hypothetical protein